MIEIHIKTDGEKVFEAVNHKHCTLGEASLVVYKLRQIENQLLNKEFESDFHIEEEE